MVEQERDMSNFFFNLIKKIGKYEIKIEGNSALIIPRIEEEYYKPFVVVKDLAALNKVLYEYLEAVKNFYHDTDILSENHNIGYFFNNLFTNLTNSDAMDFTKYIEKRISFFEDKSFKEFEFPTLTSSGDNYDVYVQRRIASLGFESPYTLNFLLKIGEEEYNLPLIRYAIDEENTCHLFAVQFDRHEKNPEQTDEYKKIINSINSGVKKYRNIQPSFVFVLKLFLDILNMEGIDNIVATDFLFSRYKRYYKGNTIAKSDKILKRILDDYLLLFQRMEYQFPFFEISNYPNEIDSYTHIKLKSFK